LHLATRYADQVILLGGENTQKSARVKTGSAEEMLTEKHLSALFGATMVTLEGGEFRSFVPRS